MGGEGSGRKSIKGETIGLILAAQVILHNLLYKDFSNNLTRDELKLRIKSGWEEVEGIKKKVRDLKEPKVEAGRSAKTMAIDFLLQAERVLNALENQDLDSKKPREELEKDLRGVWKDSQVVQEELERL
jgi:hypothetical protein